uniref:MYND-type domain-containing protein n=1 Tax=Mycena chlorophos TaxID=658473 RepID=A0ABQ0LM47_MYCCL|nr:predicted protein [Mycena chlorophos]
MALISTGTWHENAKQISVDALLPVLLFHLDARKIPRVNLPPIDEITNRAWAALAAFEWLDLKSAPAARAKLVANGDAILNWTQVLYNQRAVEAKPTPEQASKVLSRIAHALRRLLSEPELYPRIRAEQGIAGFCARLCFVPGSPLEAFVPLALMGKLTNEEISELGPSVQGADYTIGRLLLEAFKKVIISTPLKPQAINVFLMILNSLVAFPENNVAFFALLDHNAVWLATRALTLVAEALDAKSDDRADLLLCVGSALTFLRAALVEHEPPRLVAQSIDAGLLRSICLLSFALDTKAKDSMMFLSVIKIMKREQRDLESELVDRTISRPGSFLASEWYVWMILLISRATIAKLPKEVKGTRFVSCDNVSCKKAGRKSELLRCSGCLYVYYCSKECQKASWKTHKPMCRLKSSANSKHSEMQYRMMFTEADARFLREILHYESQIHFHHLKKLAERTCPDKPVEQHIVGIDYSNPKYPAGTCYLKDLRTYAFPPVDPEALDPANVAAQNEEMIKVVRRNPRDYTFIETIFMHGKNKLTRNFVFNANIFIKGSTFPESVDWANNPCENNDASMPTGHMQMLDVMMRAALLEKDDEKRQEMMDDMNIYELD